MTMEELEILGEKRVNLSTRRIWKSNMNICRISFQRIDISLINSHHISKHENLEFCTHTRISKMTTFPILSSGQQLYFQITRMVVQCVSIALYI